MWDVSRILVLSPVKNSFYKCQPKMYAEIVAVKLENPSIKRVRHVRFWGLMHLCKQEETAVLKKSNRKSSTLLLHSFLSPSMFQFSTGCGNSVGRYVLFIFPPIYHLLKRGSFFNTFFCFGSHPAVLPPRKLLSKQPCPRVPHFRRVRHTRS